MKKQMQIRIYLDGKIDARTLGIKSKKCIDYMETFERFLNAQVVNSTFTDEYYQTEKQDVSEAVIRQDNI